MKTTCASCGSSEAPASERAGPDRAGVRRVLLLIVGVWLLTRAYPLSQTVPWTAWEVWEAKKLLEYGFLERQGGIINNHYMTGRVPDPAKFNYTNHPYPMLWLDTLAYALGGQWACLLLNSGIELAGCLMVLLALRLVFGPWPSLVGAMLYTLAPASVMLDVNPSTVVRGSVAWPFLVWWLGRGLEQEQRSTAVWMGVTTFVAGQINWLTYTLLAPLALVAAGLTPGLGRDASRRPRWKLLSGLTAGWALTAAVFVAQILYYTPDLSRALDYARAQAGTEAAMSLARMELTILLRSALSAGPALIVGAAAGLWLWWRRRDANWLEWASAAYLVVFAATAVLLSRFFFREISMYKYLVFPLSVLAAGAVQRINRRNLDILLLALSVAGLVYPLVRASIPAVSETAKALGAQLRSLSQPEDVIATNLQTQRPPFEAWDVGGIGCAAQIADRLLRPGVMTKSALDGLLEDFQASRLQVVYVWDPAKPIDEALKDFLAAQKVTTLNFDPPKEPPSLAARLRSFYWKLAGKHQVADAAAPGTMVLRVYRFELRSGEKSSAP
ncbi:MAG: hypothetical protein N2689_02480 [Verrucomicrobiae bacterium]|nr:hypothetical protein [Verrucomicrobiae bacterium]